ncbi:MAG: CPBP family intramembrane metalloprotease [Lachnospiraceae bacterium]|nr:CPBP family intramembrane metalloprotease [Lachnospiraceae bacterium]
MSENKSVNRLFLISVLLYVGVSLGMGVAANWIPALTKMSNYGSILLSQILVFLPPFLYCKWKKIRIKEFIPYRKINLATIVLVVVCTYLMYPLIIVINAISMLFTTSGTTAVMDMMQGQNLVLSLLFMAILPACVEEFLFRGVLFQTYQRSKMLPAIFLSGFLFGCMHMNLNQFMYAFVLGVYLAFLVEATGSIFSSMLAHFTLNATSTLMTFLLPALYQTEGSDQLFQVQTGGYLSNMEGNERLFFLMGLVIWAIIAVGATCGAGGVYFAICKINHRWEHVKHMFSEGTRERIISIPLILGILISFGVMGMRIYMERMA